MFDVGDARQKGGFGRSGEGKAGGASIRKSKGEVIFRAGDKGHFMFQVLRGAIAIEIDGVMIETITAGGIVGEMALIDEGGRRSATVVAMEDSEMQPINQNRFRGLVRENPDFALDVMKVFARRLKEMNERLRAD